jgi:very-short-patch-repair endonuclease
VASQDHREPDFLVCKDGVWGILEVSYHPDRFEKDQEKDTWFKKAGILCIQHYTAERCYNNPADVVDEFLGILAQHKR